MHHVELEPTTIEWASWLWFVKGISPLKPFNKENEWNELKYKLNTDTQPFSEGVENGTIG